MEESWFDGTPAEALAALDARACGGPVEGERARRLFAIRRQVRDLPGREMLYVAATAVGARTRLYWQPGPDVPDGTYLYGSVIPPARIAAATAWIDTAWAATASVHVLEDPAASEGWFLPGSPPPPEPAEPTVPAGPRVLAVVSDPGELAAMRRDSTTGTFAGDTCRCLADLTLQLRDAGGHVLGEGELHGHGSVVWEPERFHLPVILPDPFTIRLRLIDWGVPGQLSHCYYDLAAGLRDELPAAAPKLSQPPSGAGLVEVLDWLGTLKVPGDALRGSGVEGRRLLDAYPAGEVIAAVATDASPQRLLGAINWAMHQPDDLPMARVLAPAIRRLL